MASDTSETLQETADADFVLLDETELRLPDAGDVVVVDAPSAGAFWRTASGADAPLPALDELISDHVGHEPPTVVMTPEAPDHATAQVCLLNPADYAAHVISQSLVDIIVDDGSGGSFVA